MSSTAWFALLLLAVGLERLVELVISRRNLTRAVRDGGFESGRGHFPAMVVLHTALLVGALAEVVLLDRSFVPVLGWTALVVALACQAGRYWCIASLGAQWNTRVVVVPGLSAVARGPYRWLRHPNYVVVVVEGVALPLVHSAWLTALVFTVANAVLLVRHRIPAEEAALASLSGPR